MYTLGTQNIPPVLPNTGSGEIFVVVAGITLAVGAAVVLSTAARQLAKKYYGA